MFHLRSTSEAKRTAPISLFSIKRDSVNARIMEAMLRHRTLLVLAENGVVHDMMKVLNPIIISVFKLIRDPKSPLVLEAVNIAHKEILKTASRATEITEAVPVSPQVASSVADSLTELIQSQLEGSEAQLSSILERALHEVARTEFDVVKEIIGSKIPPKIADILSRASLGLPEAKKKVVGTGAQRILRGGIGGELDQAAINNIVNNPLGGGFAPRLKQRYGASLNRVREVLKAGMVGGVDVPTIGRRVKGVLDSELRGGAARLARTEIHRVANEAQQEMYNQNKDIIKQQQWAVTLDANTCLRCASLDGKKFDVGRGPTIPLHPNCRCIYTPVTKSWSELGIGGGRLSMLEKRAMNGKIPGRLNFRDFFNAQGKDFQKAVLGPTRFDMFERGAIKFDQLATAQRIKPIKQLLKIAKKPTKKIKTQLKRLKKRKKIIRIARAPTAQPVTLPQQLELPAVPQPKIPGLRQPTVPGAEHPSFGFAKSTPAQVDTAFSDVMMERAHELTGGNIVNKATLAQDFLGANANVFKSSRAEIEAFYKLWGWDLKFGKTVPGAVTWNNKIFMHERIKLGLGRLWDNKLLKPWMKRRAPSRIPGFTGLPPGASTRTMRALYLQDPEKAAMFKNLVHENIHIIGRQSAPRGVAFSPDHLVYKQNAFRALEEGVTETLAKQEYKNVARKMFGFSEAETAAIADAPAGGGYRGWERLVTDLDTHMPKNLQGRAWLPKIKYSTKLENGFDEIANLINDGLVEKGVAKLDSAKVKKLSDGLKDLFGKTASNESSFNLSFEIDKTVSRAISGVPAPPVVLPPITAIPVPVPEPVVPRITGLRAKISPRIRDEVDKAIKELDINLTNVSDPILAGNSNFLIDFTLKKIRPKANLKVLDQLRASELNTIWKGSSSDALGLNLRQSAREVFGGDVFAGTRKITGAEVKGIMQRSLNFKFSPAEIDELVDGMKDWVQIRYEVTQRVLEIQKVKSVRLFRGVDAGGTSLQQVQVGEKVVLKKSTGSASSFSRRKLTSEDFGNVTFQTEVKAENILGNFRTGMGHTGEQEWVVLGNETDFLVTVTKNRFPTTPVLARAPTKAAIKRKLKKQVLKKGKLIAKKEKLLVRKELKRKKLVAKKKAFAAKQELKKAKVIARREKIATKKKLDREKLLAKKREFKAKQRLKREKITVTPSPTPAPAPAAAPKPTAAKPTKKVPGLKNKFTSEKVHPKIAKAVSSADDIGEAFSDVLVERMHGFGGVPVDSAEWASKTSRGIKNAFARSDKEVKFIMNNKNIYGKADWNGDVWLEFDKRRKVARLFDDKKLTNWLIDEFEDLEDEILDWSLKAKRAKYLSVESNSEAFGTYVHETTHLQGRIFGGDALADKSLYTRIEFRVMEEGLTESIALKDTAEIARRMFGFDAVQAAKIPTPANGYKVWTDMLQTVSRHVTGNLRADRVWLNKLKYESRLSDRFKTLAKWIDDGLVERGSKALSTGGLKTLESNLQKVFTTVDQQGAFTIDNAVAAATKGISI